jgi:hypothetical protein
MAADPNSQWVHDVAIPIIFTLFGTGLGVLVAEFRDWLKAKRDKDAFLKAVGMELDALSRQLEDWSRAVKESLQNVRDGAQTGPQFGAVLQTTVFSSQLGKLRDVNDRLLADVILFYSELGIVDQAMKVTNETGAEFTRAEIFQGTQESVRGRLASTLRVTDERILIASGKLKKLRVKLPPSSAGDANP